MQKFLQNLTTTIFIVSLLFSFKSFLPDTVWACCDDNECAPGVCVNKPSSNCGAPGVGGGVCVNDLETCSSNSQCDNGTICVGRLCRFPNNPSSFMAGTMVSTPEGGKKIEDLKVGDRVISFTGNTIVESIVSKTHKVRRDYYFDLVADGYRVKVTG